MNVEQAIFTSADTTSMKGYQLVARSTGIDSALARQLSHWGPTHGSLLGAGTEDWSLNYFAADNGWAVVSRTANGGPEYSRRGGFKVVTLMLALRDEQFVAYQYNALAVARTALALGFMRFDPLCSNRLGCADLPDHPLIDRANHPAAPANPIKSADVLGLLDTHAEVAMIGLRSSWTVLQQILEQLPLEQRFALSFTTGLKPSVHRRFRLHFLPTTDQFIQSQLTSMGIHCVHVSQPDQS